GAVSLVVGAMRAESQTSSAYSCVAFERTQAVAKNLSLYGVFHLPFRPLAGETTTSTKGRTMKTITKLIYLAFTVVILAIGAVTANGAPNDLFVSINGDGNNGGGFIYKYNPGGVQSIFAAGLSQPRGVAFDQFGNLFVVTNTFDSVSGTLQVSIVKITPGGVQSTFATLSGNLKGLGVRF